MSSIFIAICHDIERDTIHGVFSTREKAEEIAELSGSDVEEWTLDLPMSECVKYGVEMYATACDAVDVRVNELTPVATALGEPRVGASSHTWLSVFASGRTREEAIARGKAFFDQEAIKCSLRKTVTT